MNRFNGKRWFSMALALILGLLLFAAGSQPVAAQTGSWEARYWNNVSLSGTPVLQRSEPSINHNWGSGSPHPIVNNDNFSASWTRELVLEIGRYQFTVTADDGVRLWVNNQLVIDEWQEQAATTFTAVVDITDPLVPVRMEYFEAQGLAVAQLSWTRIAAGPAAPSTPSPGTWQAEYFNNTTLTGPPVLTRGEAGINFNWGFGSPAPGVVNSDRFSARWMQTFDLAPGTYTITVSVDDGARVYVGGHLLIDAWRVQALTTYDASFIHAGGQVPVVVEYFENTGLAQIELVWSGPGIPPGEGVTATMTGAFYLNVRSGPGMAFEPFDVLRRNQTVPVIGRDAFAFWLEVVLPDGSTGWVSARYMTSGTPFVALPVTG